MNNDIKINDFQGPLDLLLTLLEKEEVDIMDIPIARITDQYNKIIDSWNIFDLEEASDYILMAARLMQIKARMLVPKKVREKEEDPRTELANQLALYSVYQKIARFLEERDLESSRSLIKDPEYFSDSSNEIPPKISIKNLERSMRRMLNNRPRNEINTDSLIPDQYNIKDIKEIILEQISIRNRIQFNELLGTGYTAEKVIVTFLAILELYKIGSLNFNQDESEIFIFRET